MEAIINDKEKLMAITQAVFTEADTDGSGNIDRAELKVSMAAVSQQAGIDPPSDAQVDEVLKSLDTDNDGTIDVYEFKVLVKDILKGMQEAA